MPEVGVESSAEVLEITAIHVAEEKKYRPSYPHDPWGYTGLRAAAA